MNYLENKLVYTSSPIEFSNIDWHQDAKKVLTERFKLKVFNPKDDPKQQWVETLKKAREEKDIDTIVKITRAFVRKDLGVLDRSDILIAYLPHKVPTTGTCHEIINSNNSKKPTLLVADGHVSRLPMWYFGFIPTEFMFDNWDKLYEYLDSVNRGEQRHNNRWDFVYGDI